jgi:hypothetical protein
LFHPEHLRPTFKIRLNLPTILLKLEISRSVTGRLSDATYNARNLRFKLGLRDRHGNRKEGDLLSRVPILHVFLGGQSLAASPIQRSTGCQGYGDTYGQRLKRRKKLLLKKLKKKRLKVVTFTQQKPE